MKRNPVGPLAKKAPTRPLKKEDVGIELADKSLETINEEESSSLPEVTADIRERTEQPDDAAIIASYNVHQEAFVPLDVIGGSTRFSTTLGSASVSVGVSDEEPATSLFTSPPS